MRKIRKRVFAAVLAAVLLFTMPGTASYAEAGGQSDEITESVTGLGGTDDAEETDGAEESDGSNGAETGDGDIGEGQDLEEEEGKESDNSEEDSEEEEKETENPEENPEEEGKETENPEENPEEDEEEMGGEDSALMESGGRNNLVARIGAQSEQTEASIASVTVDGVTSYYDHLDYLRIAWKEAQGKTAVIRILRDVDLGRYELMIDNGDSNFTLEMSEGVTLSGEGGSSGKRGFMQVYAGSLTMKNGTLHNTMGLQGRGVDIRGGSFILESGTVKTDGRDKWNTAIHAESGSTVLIKGGEIIADKYGLYVGSKSSITIESGKITAGENGTAVMLSNCTTAEITAGEFTGGSGGIYLEAGSVKIKGGTFSGNCGAASGNSTAVFRLTGGTFIGTSEALRGGNGKPISWLEAGCCYYNLADGNIIPSALINNYYWKTSVRVGECNHSLWQDWTTDEEDNHSHVCQGCGKTEFGPHHWDGGGKCTICEQQAVASVSVAGETKYYSLLSNAWKAVQGMTATVKIIHNVNLEEDILEMNDQDSNITLEMAEGVILERPKNTGCLIHITNGNFTFASGTAEINNYQISANLRDASVILIDGGNVRLEGGMLTNISQYSLYGCGIKVNGGRLVVSGGNIEFTNSASAGVHVDGGEAVIQGGSITAVSQGVKVTGGGLIVKEGARIQGGEKSGYGLQDFQGASVLYGGIFTGGTGAIYSNSSNNVKRMLGEGCAYYNLDDAGNKTLVLSVSANLKGTVAVAPCVHDCDKWTADGNGSHTYICKVCGIEETEACDYEYKDASVFGASGKDGHVVICTLCGHKKTQQAEAHIFAAWRLSDTENVYARTCTACEWQHTAEVTQSSAMLQAVYDAIGEQELSAVVTGAEASYDWRLQGADDTLGTAESYTIPTNLPAGDYIYQCTVTLEGDSEPTVILTYSLSVVQASLEEASVEVAEGEGFIYDGEKIEPDITVKLDGKTLEKEVDYTVAYADNVKVGTATLTITGIGNYAGTVSKNFTIRYYETELAAEGPGNWCNRAQISAPEGFAISDSLEGEFGDAFYYSTETSADGAEITYYLKQDGTGYITDAKTIRVKVDTTQPFLDGTGNGIKITDRDAWWQGLLSKITFGHYKTQEVTVQATDSLSGIGRIYYYVDRTQGNTPLSAEELRELGSDKWESSDLVTFTLGDEDGYVIYAYAVDKAGNQSAYICSDGIVIDNTPPMLALEKPQGGGLKDTSAVPLARMNEAGNITYILLDAADSGITAEKILHSADRGTGSITAEQAGKDIELYFSGLRANVTYYLYAVGTDAAGNISNQVASLSFTTQKSPIAGTVLLAGKEVFGETLTASVEIETEDSGKVSYQWHRIDGNGNAVEIPGAESESYTLTAEDIGKNISVKVMAAGYTGVLEAQTERPVRKGEGMEIPGTVSGSYTVDGQSYTYIVDAIAGAEYRMDGGAWQKSNAFTDISPGSSHIFEARMAETDCYEAGDVKGTGQVAFPKMTPAAPAFSLIFEANGETDYTVTIPLTEGCEYSFDGETWSADNVKTGVKANETVTGYMRYKETDEYHASSPASDSVTMPKFTVKTPVISPAGGSYSGSVSVTITCGSPDAEIYYTTDGSTPSRGSTRYTRTFTVSAPATVKAIAIKDGLNDSAVAEVSYTKQGGGSGGQDTGIPFIKGEDGKAGWDVIRAEEEKAEEGSTINIDMNGVTVVPGDIFDAVKDRDITITFDMGNGIFWSVDGKSIITDKANDIDFSVKTGTDTIPVDIMNNITGERYSIQISLAYEGEFGLTAVLSMNLGRENGGYTASLYYYNEGTGKLEFICADEVAQDGTVSLAFTHASDYVIAIDGDKEEENGNVTDPGWPESPQPLAGMDESARDVPESPKTGQEKKNVLWLIMADIVVLAGIAFAGVPVWKKKKKSKSVKGKR